MCRRSSSWPRTTRAAKASIRSWRRVSAVTSSKTTCIRLSSLSGPSMVAVGRNSTRSPPISKGSGSTRSGSADASSWSSAVAERRHESSWVRTRAAPSAPIMSTRRTGSAGCGRGEWDDGRRCRPKARWAEALVSSTMPSPSMIRMGAWFESNRSRYKASADRWASRDVSASRRAERSAETRCPMRSASPSSRATCMSSAQAATCWWVLSDVMNLGMDKRVIHAPVDTPPAKP